MGHVHVNSKEIEGHRSAHSPSLHSTQWGQTGPILQNTFFHPSNNNLYKTRSGPRFRFWILTGLSGFDRFFKLKWYHFSKKKIKINGFTTGSWPGLAGPTRSLGHTGFFLPLFFLQPGPVPVSDRLGPRSTRWAGRDSKLWF
jgi:hypothetical protein